jgi:hypothetical protein
LAYETIQAFHSFIPGELFGCQAPGILSTPARLVRIVQNGTHNGTQRLRVVVRHHPTCLPGSDITGYFAELGVDHGQAAPHVVDSAAGEGKLALGVWEHDIDGDVGMGVALHELIMGEEAGHADAGHGAKHINKRAEAARMHGVEGVLAAYHLQHAAALIFQS